MTDLIIQDEKLKKRLLDIARRENRPVEAVLETLLNRYPNTEPEKEPKPGTFAALAKSALEADLSSDESVDTSERTREIMHNEYADYIRRNKDEEKS